MYIYHLIYIYIIQISIYIYQQVDINIDDKSLVDWGTVER